MIKFRICKFNADDVLHNRAGFVYGLFDEEDSETVILRGYMDGKEFQKLNKKFPKAKFNLESDAHVFEAVCIPEAVGYFKLYVKELGS